MKRNQSSVKALLVAALFTIFACQRESDKVIVVKEFPIEEKLDTICTVLPEYYEHLTNSVNSAGDFIVVVNYKSPFALSVFDSNLCLADTILSIGQGHDEMLSPVFYGQWKGSDSNPEIIVFDSETKDLAGLNIHPFGGLKTIADLIGVDALSPSCVYLLSQSELAGVNLPIGEQAKVFKYDLNDKELTFAPDYVKFTGELAFYSSQCGLAIDKDGEQFAVPYFSVPILCVLDKNFNLVRKIFINEEIDTETLDRKSSHNGFIDAKYVGDKIVALYLDSTEKSGSKLMVFDHRGNPLASYSVGKALGFCFDKEYSKIMTLSYDDESGSMKFYEYAIPQLIKG